MKELLVAITLIAGFSITGLWVGSEKKPEPSSVSFVVEDVAHRVPLAANPVVHISVPAHNIFTPH